MSTPGPLTIQQIRQAVKAAQEEDMRLIAAEVRAEQARLRQAGQAQAKERG